MPSFDVTRQSPVDTSSFRYQYIQATYDLKMDKIVENFKGDINPPKGWKIGLIVGPSGTGKTTIAKELYGDYIFDEWEHDDSKSVIDEMPKGKTMDEITRMFTIVGFGSAPSWLKPYSVLSNGEKMRVNLAHALLSGKEMVVFDEFTSVIDRNTAQSACIALHRTLVQQPMQFIAVSCHYDVEQFLEPDWVLDTSDMSFRTGEQVKKRDIKNSQSANVTALNGVDSNVIII